MQWRDYSRAGRWTHSILMDSEGNCLATCWGRYHHDHDIEPFEVGLTYAADDTEEFYATRALAKRAGRKKFRS